ncbi:response regulator transcription factor [Paenibacillus lactis]|uniref:Two component transcriptional regulator, winged helix family n=2 Tax=Paenibacillus lactis TaxID=228574 RepID=G4HMT0_9BACL|nr:response regulator transcription factor [Paenibacillus lactis]EHB54295.1 two component transcriptional regulator, winged helix family [Paenibacillus lactis 154]MBP1891554.1 two-component system OmpR family response regulator [Paenibacillus lactis]MCM3494018.1 response regulator transcription factor [Paenibacillus lactis]GIO88794.1 DNA-binding response regulator [Paenibacillus lactis]HAG00441.1 DNA-binding response regulator [Paenibacillus lactis]
MESFNGIRVLLVDDEPHILQFLELGLRNEGFDVKTAFDGESALAAVHSYQPHVIILDVMMPGTDGLTVCRRLKEEEADIAIIMLTAKDEIDDRVKGLLIGADDYMAKPFSFEELLARIQARLRNQFPSLLGEIRLGPFVIDDRKKEIAFRGEALGLSPTEYKLLKLLVTKHGTVLSKTNILNIIWNYDFGGEDNIVEVYIRSLREKLGDKEHRIIRTLRGAGYRVDLP